MKKIILLIILISNFSYSQDTIYLDKKFEKTENLNEREYFQLTEKSKISDLTIEKLFLINNILKSEKIFKNKDSDKRTLVEKKFYYPNGQLHIDSHFKNEKMHGDFFSYWENGQLKRQDLYKNGKFKEGKCWSQNGKTIEFYEFESNPEFSGGSGALAKYIRKNVDPAFTTSNNKGKKVVIQFAIDMNGQVKDIVVKEFDDPILANEAVRIINNMPNWKPATQDGNKVKVTRTIPITF